MEKDIYVLGIESSCDETSVAIVKNGREILSNVINTQIKIHENYGGVVPEIASRCHTEVINQVTKQALKEANMSIEDIDVICMTYGPGLVGALLVGVSYAKGLSFASSKPLLGVNHIEGHIIDSKECFERAIEINPNKPEAYVLLAQTLQLMSGYDNPEYKNDAEENYKKAMEIYRREKLNDKAEEMRKQLKHLSSSIILT